MLGNYCNEILWERIWNRLHHRLRDDRRSGEGICGMRTRIRSHAWIGLARVFAVVNTVIRRRVGDALVDAIRWRWRIGIHDIDLKTEA